MWKDRRLLDLFQIEHPIVLAPMAGPSTPALAAAVANAGGLGSLAFAMLSPDQMRAELSAFRAMTNKDINVNFFCHTPPAPPPDAEARWRRRLAPYYAEHGLDAEAAYPAATRNPFDAVMCALVEATRPRVVSFHFGLPETSLLARVKAAGCLIMSSATTVAEARWLESRGVDAIIAQGFEAGGHRGMFLTDSLASQVGTMALVPQVVDAVKVPVIAAGGIADARGIVAALALGAAGVQVGTAYLFTPEAKVPPLHRTALETARDDGTALTNVFTGRPARGIVNRLMREAGPISPDAPPFPLAGGALAPLRSAAEAKGAADFTSLWSGQAMTLARSMPAGDLTRKLAEEALARLR
jgi:nitronate monooxygenase